MNSWNTVLGTELEEILDSDGRLDEILPRRRAIYMWKRSYRAKPTCIASPTEFFKFCESLAESHAGTWVARGGNHFIQLVTVELGGSGLTLNQADILKAFLSQRKNRHWMKTYLESLESMSPSLYVGETGSLPERIEQHMNGTSNFGSEVNSSAKIEWANLCLYYFDLGEAQPIDEDSPVRKAIEYLSASLTQASMTRRAG